MMRGRRARLIVKLLAGMALGLMAFNLIFSFTETSSQKIKVAGNTQSQAASGQVEGSAEAGRAADMSAARLLGNTRPNKAFLAVGIPTVRRSGGSYLAQTLESLINNTRGQHQDVVVVILLADEDPILKTRLARVLGHYYKQYIDEGFIQVIASPSPYPDFKSLERTFNDSESRVKWRSKQALDFAMLMKYSESLAEYYIQLEDDVISSPHLVTKIKDFISAQKKPWVCLEFSRLGFIGKLYRSETLRDLHDFIMIFYAKQPADWLLRYFNILNVQSQPIFHEPSLFQHIGVRSSLANKTQPLQDKHFADWPKQHFGDNPTAILNTNMETYENWNIDLAYSLESGYFWAKTPSPGDWVVIKFEQPQRLRRVIIETGAPSDGRDQLTSGKLEAGSAATFPAAPFCSDFVYLGSFTGGRIDIDAMFTRVYQQVMCLRISVTDSLKTWLIIREIAVFLLH